MTWQDNHTRNNAMLAVGMLVAFVGVCWLSFRHTSWLHPPKRHLRLPNRAAPRNVPAGTGTAGESVPPASTAAPGAPVRAGAPAAAGHEAPPAPPAPSGASAPGPGAGVGQPGGTGVPSDSGAVLPAGTAAPMGVGPAGGQAGAGMAPLPPAGGAQASSTDMAAAWAFLRDYEQQGRRELARRSSGGAPAPGTPSAYPIRGERIDRATPAPNGETVFTGTAEACDPAGRWRRATFTLTVRNGAAVDLKWAWAR